MSWLSALVNSFITPQAFWFLGLIPLLILLYILKLRRSEVIIPSTMLWVKSLQDLTANAPFQKLRRNLLLLLQIIVLMLIILALARPFIQTGGIEGRNLCLLIDHSASMQTSAPEGTRLDQAKRRALELVETMERGDRAMVLSFAGSAAVRCELTDDRQLLREAINGIAPSDTLSDVRDAAQILRSIAPINPDVTAVVRNLEVLLFSDGKIAHGDRLAALSVPIQYIATGAPATNVGIVNFSTRGAEDGGGRQCFVQVYNDDELQVSTTLSLYFGEELIGVDDIEVGPGDTAESVFELPPLEDGMLRAQLDLSDALAADNRAWLALRQDAFIDVLVTGAADSVGLSMLRRVFSLDPRVRLSSATPENYGGVTDTFDLYLFEGWAPPEPPSGALVYINTLPTIPGLSAAGELERPAIMATDREHPLMRFTNPATVSIARAMQVTLPEGARTLVSSEGGPLIADVSQAQQPMVLIAFDIGDSNWPLHLSFPLFMQNMLTWAPSASGVAPPSLETGSPIELLALPAVESAQVIPPDGDPELVRLDPLRPVYFARTTTAGPYVVTRGEQVDRYAVNLLSREESAVRPAETLELGGLNVAAAEGPVTFNRELWRWLLLAGLAVLALEWWIYTRRAEY